MIENLIQFISYNVIVLFIYSTAQSGLYIYRLFNVKSKFKGDEAKYLLVAVLTLNYILSWLI